jgi:heptosyltransferase-3
MNAALLFRIGGLGDLLAALPALNLLRAAYPDASLHLVARKDYGGLLREAGVVDLVFPADDATWMPLFDGSLPIPPGLARRLSGYDLLAGWFQGKPEFLGTPTKRTNDGGLIGTCPRFPEKGVPSPSSPRPSLDIPACVFVYDPASRVPVSRFFFDRTAEFVRANGGPEIGFADCRRLRPAGVQIPGKFAVVHPGSGGAAKCWPWERFLRVIRFLAGQGIPGFVVTGEAEARLAGELARAALPAGWQWLDRPPLGELAGLLRSSRLYIGNDSGVTHLAAVCGTNVVAVFRREFAAAWRPLGPSTVLSSDDVLQIEVGDVLAAVNRMLASSG